MSSTVLPDSNRRRTNAQLFVGLWALYFLVNQLKQTPWPVDLPLALVLVRVGLIVAAVGVIARLHDARMFVAMLALQVVAVVLELPAMSNCWLFTGILNLGVLVIAARLYLRSRNDGDAPGADYSTESIYSEAAPLLRVSLLTLYALAALAKYNRDFLNPELSAAAYFTNMFLSSVGLNIQSPLVDIAAVWSTLVIETALPVMLFLPRSRRYAIVMGMAFHTLLAHNHNLSVFDFNAMLFALYVTFAPADLLEKVRYTEESKWVFRAVRYRLPLVLSLIAVSVIVVWWSSTTGSARLLLWRYRVALWFVIGVMMTIVATQALFSRERPRAELEEPFEFGGRFEWIVVALIFFNGMTPYLGLKTGVAYTMFSNLRTEVGYENHLLVPAWLRIFDLQEEPVRILSSSDAELAQAAKNEELVLLYDLRLRAQRLADQSITYERKGEVHHADRMADDPLLSRPLPYLARKTLHFRTIPTKDTTPQW